MFPSSSCPLSLVLLCALSPLQSASLCASRFTLMVSCRCTSCSVRSSPVLLWILVSAVFPVCSHVPRCLLCNYVSVSLSSMSHPPSWLCASPCFPGSSISRISQFSFVLPFSVQKIKLYFEFTSSLPRVRIWVLSSLRTASSWQVVDHMSARLVVYWTWTCTKTLLLLSSSALVDRFADVFFLVDSGIASNQFTLFRNELSRLLNRLEVGASGYRVGLAQYGQDVKVDFRLNTYQTKQQIVTAARRFRLRSQTGQPQNLGQALSYAKENFFTAEAGGRAQQGTPQYLVVVAGKDSDDPVFWSAENLKDEGVIIVGMDAGATKAALYRFASPGYIFDSSRVTLLIDLLTARRVETVTEGEKAAISSSSSSSVTTQQCFWSSYKCNDGLL